MNKPRIFLGSSGKQAKLLKAITRGLEDAQTSRTGALILFWRTGGTGNWFDDPNAAEETVWVPFEGS